MLSKWPHSGKNHYHWQGGRKVSNHGYILIYMADHPDARTDRYILEHRLVMEKHIGRRLKPNEHVHHINGNGQDNRIENLELMTDSKHMKLEHTIDMSNRRCSICGSDKTWIRETGRPFWRYLHDKRMVCSKCYGVIIRKKSNIRDLG